MVAKDRAADRRLQREFGITLAEYNQLLKHQKRKCAICKVPRKTGQPRLAVDHCHTSGELRGLLCWTCNRLLGRVRDDAERLRAAADYLTTPPCRIVLGQRFTAPGRVGTKKRAKLLRSLRELNGLKQN